MPPKVSQLLTRVLAREHDDDGSSSSDSEDDYDLKHIAANASAGIRMEMEMLRESRVRDKEDGVDRKACIVDRNQFFNTQVGVGYQHKTVVRQRTVEPTSGGQRVVDMSTAAAAPTEPGNRRRQKERSNRESDSSDDDGGEQGRKRKKRSKSTSKSKSKKRKRDKDEHAKKKGKKAKKEKRRGKSSHLEKEDGSSRPDRDRSEGEREVSSRSRKHKKRKREVSSKHSGDDRRAGRELGGKGGAPVTQRPASPVSSCSSSGSSSDSAEGSDEGPTGTSRSMMLPPPPRLGSKKVLTPAGEDTDKARIPLQQLRDLIEEKLRAKALKSTTKGCEAAEDAPRGLEGQ